jgi:poly(3-hydroxybutyrate) depolymerase
VKPWLFVLVFAGCVVAATEEQPVHRHHDSDTDPSGGDEALSGDSEPGADTDNEGSDNDTGPGDTSGDTDVIPTSGCGLAAATGAGVIHLTIAGVERTYLREVPDDYDPATPSTVVFMFHGAGGNHDSVTYIGHDLAASATHQQITVYPDGISREGVSSGWDESPASTDLLLIDAIIDQLTTTYCIDVSRLYAFGFSWGGWIASAAGCLRGNDFAGFASIEGGTLNSESDCQGPVPAYIQHDEHDPAEPYDSGVHVRDFWLDVDHADTPVDYDAPLPCSRYDGTEPVIFCHPDNAQHTWEGWVNGELVSFFDL